MLSVQALFHSNRHDSSAPRQGRAGFVPCCPWESREIGSVRCPGIDQRGSSWCALVVSLAGGLRFACAFFNWKIAPSSALPPCLSLPSPPFSVTWVHGGLFLAAFCRQAASELCPFVAEPRPRVSPALRCFSLFSLPGSRLRTPRPTYDLAPFGASDADPKSVCVCV